MPPPCPPLAILGWEGEVERMVFGAFESGYFSVWSREKANLGLPKIPSRIADEARIDMYQRGGVLPA